MLSHEAIRGYYRSTLLNIPRCWNLTRKHVRAVLRVGRFLKVNRLHLHLSNRSARYALHFFCVKYAPIRLYSERAC
jgi:hypothetical protein